MKVILNPSNLAQTVKHIRGSAKLIDKQKISQFVYEFTFEMLDPLEINFKAGQYIAVVISPAVRRQYSISSAPQSKKQFQMIVDIKPNGIGVNYLMNLKSADVIQFIGQIGLFVLPEILEKNLYFISTGTGIAPLKSMIEDLINRNQSKSHNIKVIFGTRYIDDIFYTENFNKYLKENLIDDYKIYLSRPDKTYPQIEEGYVTKYFENMKENDLEKAQFYICGGNEMIKSLEQQLLSKGVNAGNIIYEKFY